MKTTVTTKDLTDLSSESPKVKYRRAKALLAIARTNPQLLSRHRKFFMALLKSENSILRWTAIDIVGRLACVDKQIRVLPLLNSLVRFVRGGKLITVNHAIGALSQIAATQPRYRDRICREFLKVGRYTYETAECRNIALGNVVRALDTLLSDAPPGSHVLRFVKRQARNSRPATAAKARKLLKRLTDRS